MKRIVSLLLAVLLVAGIFTACGKKEENYYNPDFVPTEGVPNLNGKVITIMTTNTWVSGLDLSQILPRFKQVEERTGCKIIWETAPNGDYDTVVQTRLTGDFDDCPDIIMISSSTALMTKYIVEGLLYDITEAYDVCPNIKAFYEEYRTDLKGSFTYHDGGIYNVVANVWRNADEQIQWVGYDGDNALWYRADIAKELGWDSYPTTIDELYQLLSAVKEKYPDMVPMHMWNWQGWESARIFNSAYGLHYNNEQSGGYFYPDANGKIQFEPTLAATKEWLTEMNKWYKEGLIVVGASEEAKIGSAAQGKTFMGFYSDVTALCEGSLKQVKPDAYFMYMPFPSKDGYETTVMPRNAFSRSFITINNGDEEQCRAALQFLDYAFFSDYGICCEQAGVEGEGWSFDENGKFVPNESYIAAIEKNEVVVQQSGANIHYNGPSVYDLEVRKTWAETVKKVRNDLGLGDIMTPEQLENWKTINSINSSHYCAAFPVVYFTEDDLATYNAITNDLNTFVNEMLEKYILGTADLSKFQIQFVNVLYNDMNLQQAVDMQQKYYDLWTSKSAN